MTATRQHQRDVPGDGLRESLQEIEGPKRRLRKGRLSKAAAARLDVMRKLLEERRRAARASQAIRKRKPGSRPRRRTRGG